jgi:glycogen debranching enzyme
MWDKEIGFYYDLLADGRFHKKKTIAAFWTILAGVADEKQTTTLLAHLQNPDEFYRPHLFPTLAADEPEYDKSGHYWLGGVWAPTNAMLILGLIQTGEFTLAREAAENHLLNMLSVMDNFVPEEGKLPINHENVPANGDGINEIWECYSPEESKPATRWDGFYYCKQKFTGWSAVGPLLLLIESILGISFNAVNNRICWKISPGRPQGIRNLLFKNSPVSLLAEFSNSIQITVESDIPFELLVTVNGIETPFSVQRGKSRFEIEVK